MKEIKNKKAFHDYEIKEQLEVGIQLLGNEVKSIREGRVNIKDSFVSIKKGEVFILNMNISHLETTNSNYKPDELRERKLLLHKKEIWKYQNQVEKDGYTIVPTKLYFNNKNIVKLQIGIGKGKKNYDKREDLKEKSQKRDMERELKKYN